MKFLIWLGCLAVPSVIKTILEMNGIRLGMIPTILLFGAAIFLARFLVNKWKESRGEDWP